MKNVRYGLALAALCSSSMLFSQGVVDALKYSQQDIRGTARYMGMAGAFGALGGDITTLSQNPAGIGVYRNSDIAATIDLSNQVSSVNTAGNRMSDSKFNVSCNNFGFVWTVRFNQEALKNLNFGFAYNKQKSFDRSYKAGYSGITGASSLSGYIAHLSEGYSVADLAYPDNTATREELDLLNSRYLPQYEPEKDNFSITLATRRDQVDYINENRLSGLPGKEYTFTGTIKGDFPEGSLPTSLELVVKTGAQVIFIKNDPERRWVNGTIGMISDITPDEKIEVVLESGEMYELERCVWENIKYTYNEKEKTIEESVLGTFLQFPIRLAWAITVHKSQGLTFNRVIVDFTGGAFAGGQTYVALSRCRSLEGIVLKRQITHRDIFVNPDIVRFSKGFNDSVLIEQSLKLAQADRLYVEAVNAFDEGDFDKMLQSFFKAIHTRYDIEKPVIQRYIRKKLNVINQLRVKNRELQQALSDRNTVLRKYAHEYYLLGNECITKAKDVRAALANFDKALSLDPTLIDAWVRKGITLEDQGDEHGAMACYNEAVRLSPLSFKALYNRGKLRYKQGDYETALSDFAKAVKQKPLHATAHDRLGDTFIKLEMPDMAARHWAIAEELREKKQQNNK